MGELYLKLLGRIYVDYLGKFEISGSRLLNKRGDGRA